MECSAFLLFYTFHRYQCHGRNWCTWSCRIMVSLPVVFLMMFIETESHEAFSLCLHKSKFSATSVDWSSSSLLLGAAYVLWYLNKKLPLLFLFDPWIYISFFYLHGFTFQLKMIHTCQHISNCVIWFRRPNTSNCYDICLFSALETLCANSNFCRGNGYPKLWPSPNCTEPLDVSSNFTFEVIFGILSG